MSDGQLESRMSFSRSESNGFRTRWLWTLIVKLPRSFLGASLRVHAWERALKVNKVKGDSRCLESKCRATKVMARLVGE